MKILIGFCFLLAATCLQAQKLYIDSLKLDVYTPTGDNSSGRALILFSHAGSFLPPTFTQPLTKAINGTKGDSCLVELCTRFAKRGFVAASFEYRLGWNPASPNQETRTSTIINAVYRGMHDAKACIRYFTANAAQYKIDPNKIILAGTNSGAYVALLAGNLNRPDEIGIFKFLDSIGNPFIDTTVWGNYEGENGALEYYANPGSSSDFQLVLSLGGDVGDTTWVDAGEVPVIAFHGVADALSPYLTDIVTTGATQTPIIEVSGPGDYIPTGDALGNQDPLKGGSFCDGPASTDGNVYEGLRPFFGGPTVGFEPWGWYDTAHAANPLSSRTRGMAYIDTIMDYSIQRIYRALFDGSYVDDCPATDDPLPESFASATRVNNVTYAWNYSVIATAEDQTGFNVGIGNVSADVAVDVYPNPSSSDVTIALKDASQTIKAISLFDAAGKLVKTEAVKNASRYTFSRKGIEAGAYFLNIQFTEGGQTFRTIMFE